MAAKTAADAAAASAAAALEKERRGQGEQRVADAPFSLYLALYIRPAGWYTTSTAPVYVLTASGTHGGTGGRRVQVTAAVREGKLLATLVFEQTLFDQPEGEAWSWVVGLGTPDGTYLVGNTALLSGGNMDNAELVTKAMGSDNATAAYKAIADDVRRIGNKGAR